MNIERLRARRHDLPRPLPAYVTVGRLAEALDLSRATAYRLAKELGAVHVTPKALRVPVVAIRERFGDETAQNVAQPRGHARGTLKP